MKVFITKDGLLHCGCGDIVDVLDIIDSEGVIQDFIIRERLLIECPSCNENATITISGNIDYDSIEIDN